MFSPIGLLKLVVTPTRRRRRRQVFVIQTVLLVTDYKSVLHIARPAPPSALSWFSPTRLNMGSSGPQSSSVEEEERHQTVTATSMSGLCFLIFQHKCFNDFDFKRLSKNLRPSTVLYIYILPVCFFWLSASVSISSSSSLFITQHTI